MERHIRDYVQRKADEEFHPDCINYGRWPKGTGLMFWGIFRKGKMGLCRVCGYVLTPREQLHFKETIYPLNT